MAIDAATVRKVARLARIAVPEERLDPLARELSGILQWIEQLAEVDTDGVEPMTHAVPMQLRLRDDAPGAALPVEEALGQAPDRQDDFFQVPAIIKRTDGPR